MKARTRDHPRVAAECRESGGDGDGDGMGDGDGFGMVPVLMVWLGPWHSCIEKQDGDGD